jgi:hypothetical protein
MEDMLEASGMVAHFVRLTEAEIVNNRDSLIGDRLWVPRYRPSTAVELEAVRPMKDHCGTRRGRQGRVNLNS